MHSLKSPTLEFDLQQKHLTNPLHKLASGSTALPAVSHFNIPDPKQKYGPKTHYQIAFKEFGKTIDTIPQYHEVIKVLDTVTGGF